MCDHYDSYYRMTPEEEAASKAAEQRERERIEAHRKAKEEELVKDYAKRFGLLYQDALVEVRKIKFVMERG